MAISKEYLKGISECKIDPETGVAYLSEFVSKKIAPMKGYLQELFKDNPKIKLIVIEGDAKNKTLERKVKNDS